VKYWSISEVVENDDGGSSRVDREVKVFQSALSKHQRGGFGSRI